MSQDGSMTVLDLPQLYTRPSAAELLSTLEILALKPTSWEQSTTQSQVSEDGIPKYLTAIIASQLGWIHEEDRERIWESASRRLCERSGRTAIPSISRIFVIPDLSGDASISIALHEPSLTADNLGHKTWLASYLLAKRLAHLLAVLSSSCQAPALGITPLIAEQSPRVLELGAGTGLVGIAAALLFPTATVHLTDLPAIIPNLQMNVYQNIPADPDSSSTQRVTVGVLDWSKLHQDGDRLVGETCAENSFDIILAADPLYSPLHPTWLIDTISRFLKRQKEARVMVELPLREVYGAEVEEFLAKMQLRGLVLVKQGEESGFEDWEDLGDKGKKTEVKCWWGEWGWDDMQDLGLKD